MYVIIHGNQWKSGDVEASVQWAKHQIWQPAVWRLDSDRWRHDHCEICWWELFASEDPEHGQGYFSQECNAWLCTECYEQFLK